MRRLMVALVVLAAVALPTTLHADGPDYGRLVGSWSHTAGVMTVNADGAVWWEPANWLNPDHNPPQQIAQLVGERDNGGATAWGYGTGSGDAYYGAAFWVFYVPSWDSVIVTQALATGPTWTIMCGPNVPQAVFDMFLRTNMAGASGCG